MMNARPNSTPFAIAALVLICIWAPGCATYSGARSPFRHRKTKLKVVVPKGWLRYNPANPTFTMTRDGLRLESITIAMKRIGKKLPDTERVYRANMMPHEVAELSLGLIEARDDTKNFEIQKIELATIVGRDGYLAHARYTDEGGLPMRLRMYGTVIGKYVCEFGYAAAESVYFEKYEKTFEDLVASARIVPK